VSTFDRLARKLAEAGLEIPEGTVFQRLHPGHWQKAAGAWSWFAQAPDGRSVCGSQYPATELLKGLTVNSPDRYREMDGAVIEPRKAP
jgi:hypothetical protein